MTKFALAELIYNQIAPFLKEGTVRKNVVEKTIGVLVENPPIDEQAQEKINQLTESNTKLDESNKAFLRNIDSLTASNKNLEEANKTLLEEIANGIPNATVTADTDSKILDLIEQLLEMR